MLILALAVLCSASIPLIFRAFGVWRVSVTWAIPVNYLICVVLGGLFSADAFELWTLRSWSWQYLAIPQGLVLAGNFYLLAFTAQRSGVTIAALASRLSIAIPVALAFILYGDSLTPLKIAGLAGALISLYLSSLGGGILGVVQSRAGKILPPILFLSFGFHFSLFKYVQAFYLNGSSYHIYLTLSFFFAFCVSLSAPFRRLIVKQPGFRFVDLYWGVFLGVVNYVTIYLLVKALSLEGWESSQIFPTYSVGSLTTSSLLAMALFNERLSKTKSLGLAVGLISVAILNR